MLGGDDDEPSTKSKPAAPRISNPSNLQMNSQQTNQAQAQVSEKSKPATGGGGGLFDLDWHEPAPSTSNPTSPFVHSNNKGKNDILSLFGNSSGGGGGFQQQQQQQGFNQQQQSGLSGLDGFGGMNLGNNNHQNSNFGGVTSPVLILVEWEWEWEWVSMIPGLVIQIQVVFLRLNVVQQQVGVEFSIHMIFGKFE